MLDLKFIRENPDAVRKAIRDKRVDLDLDKLISFDEQALEARKRVQALQEQKNANAKRVPQASPTERPALIEAGRKIGAEIEDAKKAAEEHERRLQELLYLVPNIPAPDAPVGATADENVEIRRWGRTPEFGFKPLHHVDLLEKNGWADLERVAKVSGSRTYALKGEMVLLESVLLRFALDKLHSKGFTLITVPALVRESALYGTGHLPTAREQTYHLQADDLYLSGTAEVPITGLHSGEILEEPALPILYGGISPCFRREAGSAGKDVRGLIRVHQFMKVEQFVICRNDPAESARWHQTLLATSEELVQALELPYRVIEVCTGDMGAGKFRMHDLEVWVPSEGKYRETHSCSSLHEWQARRADLRYRDDEKKVKYCHTLNNTAIATPRLIAPLIEVHQQADGSVRVPPALRPYLGGADVLRGRR